MKYSLFLLLFSFSFVAPFFAQNQNQATFESESLSFQSPILATIFTEVKIVTIPTQRIKSILKNKQTHQINLKIEDLEWSLKIQSAEICPEGTPIQIDNRIRLKSDYDPTFQGTTQEKLPFRLTINDGFVAGILPLSTKEYFLEPLSNFDALAPSNSFIFYEKSAIKPSAPHKCLVEEAASHTIENTQIIPRNNAKNCAEVDLAVATDMSMIAKYGTINGVSNRVNSVMNLVAGLYLNAFDCDIKFKIVTWFHAQDSNPWAATNSAGDLLESFSTWGDKGGFGTTYDLGQFWTNRDFTGNTIGIAWLSGVCAGDLKHHAIQDFSDNMALMRCVVAHEIGHNFSLTHNSDIMAPTVSSATTWSASSVAQMNKYLPSVTGSACLALCISGTGSGNPNLAPIANFTTDEDSVCTNRQVQFEDFSTNVPTSYKWTFDGGTPSTSSIPNPKTVYKTAGTYNVTLTVSNFNGTHTLVKKIHVITLPVVSFTHKVKDLNATFTNTTVEKCNWLWKFGDNKTSIEKNPSHTYLTQGTYSVILTATNKCGMRATSKAIQATPAAPSAAFKADTLKGCVPLTVKFTNLSSNAQSFTWKLDGAKMTSFSGKEPVAVYEKAGQYDVRLIATNAGLVDTFLMHKAITVLSAPKVAFTKLIYDGGQIQLRSNVSGADSIRWDFGDGTSQSDSVVNHLYKKSGRYFISLKAKNACDEVVLKDSIDILLAPIAGFEVDSHYVNCEKVTIPLKNTSSDDVTTFVWKTPSANSDSSLIKEPILTYSKSGIYEIKLVVKNATGTDTLIKKVNVTVKELPIAAFGDSVFQRTLYLVNKSQYGKSYVWDFGDGQTSQDTIPNHVYVNDGKYTIKLKVINDCDTVTYKKEINVVTSPKADFTYNIVNFCTPAIVNFQQKASNNTATFHWVFEGGTPNVSNEPNPIIKYEKVGIYAASLVVKNATGSDSVHQKAIIEVKTSPRAGFSFVQKGAELAFDNKSVGAVSYHWDFGDSTTSTEDNPKHIYTKTGKYKVALNAINDCGESSFTEIISLNFVANKELQAENSLSVFPNPTDGIFTLVLKENNDSALRFHLINSLGQVFSLENNNLNHDATYQFDLRHLPKGIYHLSVGGRNKEQWIKIVLVK